MKETTIFSEKGYKITKDDGGHVFFQAPGGSKIQALEGENAARRRPAEMMKADGSYGNSFSFLNGRAKAEARIANKEKTGWHFTRRGVYGIAGDDEFSSDALLKTVRKYGGEAKRAGWSQDRNPYRESKEREEWDRGWLEG